MAQDTEQDTEQDTVMEDSANISYPAPGATDPNPYPALPANGASVQTSTADTGFSTLEDYFKLGEKALFNLSKLHRSTSQGGHWESSMTGDGYYTTSAHSQTPTSDTNATLPLPGTRPFALPGFHFLPDDTKLKRSSSQVHQGSFVPSTQQSPRTQSEQRRGPGRPRSTRGGWKQAIQGTDHAELFKTPRLSRQSTGIRRGRVKGIRGSRHADPGQEYKSLQGQATAAYLDGDLELAREHASAAVQVNPEVWASYSLLSEIFQKQGLEPESIHMLTIGAPIKRDPETWVEVATRIRTLSGADITKEQREFALKCYEEAIKLDSGNYNARRERMELYCESEDWKGARRECSTLVTLQPRDIELVFKYALLCQKTGYLDDLRGAIDCYEKLFKSCLNDPSLGIPNRQWDHLNMYLEMLVKTGPPHTGVYQLKQIARWFLGRQDDFFWNDLYLQNDCEFDEGSERRVYIPQVQTGRVSQDANRYGKGLPMEIRVKLGVFRLQMGANNHAEAFRHFEHLRRMTDLEEVEDFSDLFLDIANNLRSRLMYGAAVEYYDRLVPISAGLNREYWMDLAQCCREVGRNDEAEKYYKKLVDANDLEIDARINLVKLYDTTCRSMKALPIVDELIQIGRSDTLRNANLGTYLTACKRVKKKALREAAQSARKQRSIEPESDHEPYSDAEMTDEEPTEILPPKRPPKRRPKAQQKLRQLAAKPSKNQPAPPPAPLVVVNSPEGEESADSSSDEEIDEGEELPNGANDDEVEEAIAFEDADNPTDSGQSNTEDGSTSKRGRGAQYTVFLHEQRERVQTNYAKVTELWPTADTNSDPAVVHTWIRHAAAMANEFKQMKEFYPLRSRDNLYTGLRTGIDTASRILVAKMEALKRRLFEDAAKLGQVDTDAVMAATSTANTAFHGLTFAEWHRIFSSLALLYARRSDQTQCYYILEHVLMPANVFRDDTVLSKATFSVGLCCSLMFNDTRFSLAFAKRLGLSHAPAVANQLLAACGRLGHGENDFYRRKTATWLAGALEEQDYLAMSPEARASYNWDKARERLEERAKQVGDGKVDLNPGALTTYAHMIGGRQHGNSNNATLPYLMRALAIEPENVVVNLSIAVMNVTQALRKAPDVDQREIAQGIAFLYRYYDLRVASGKACHLQEAEYNLARMWQRLNMMHLAVPAYEKVLGLSAEVHMEAKRGECSEVEGYAQEAAVALQHMYVAAGNEDAARRVTEEWLVL